MDRKNLDEHLATYEKILRDGLTSMFRQYQSSVVNHALTIAKSLAEMPDKPRASGIEPHPGQKYRSATRYIPGDVPRIIPELPRHILMESMPSHIRQEFANRLAETATEFSVADRFDDVPGMLQSMVPGEDPVLGNVQQIECHLTLTRCDFIEHLVKQCDIPAVLAGRFVDKVDDNIRFNREKSEDIGIDQLMTIMESHKKREEDRFVVHEDVLEEEGVSR